jgi:hypothetical protein
LSSNVVVVVELRRMSSSSTRDGLILANAVFFAGMGLLALALPHHLAALVGFPADLTPDGKNEVRAVYGGFGVAVAAVLGLAVLDESLTKGVAAAVGASLAGMAGGRVVAVALERGKVGRMPLLFFAVESSLAAMLFVAALKGQ